MTLPRFRNANCGRPPKLTEAQVRAAHALALVKGVKAAARRYDVTAGTLRVHWRSLDLPSVVAERVNAATAARRDAYARYCDGATAADLAAELGIEVSALYLWWRERGLTWRRGRVADSDGYDPMHERIRQLRARGHTAVSIYATHPDIRRRYAHAGSMVVQNNRYQRSRDDLLAAK